MELISFTKMLQPGYKQTDLGVLPEEWEVKTLKEVLKETRLGGNYANSTVPSHYPLIKMGNMGRGSMAVDKLEYVKPGQQVERKHKLKYGDLLFNTRNTLDLVGKVSVWKDELPEAYYNSNILQLIFDKNQVASTFFINYILNTEQAIVQMRGLATGTTSVAAVYTRDLLSFQIPIPPPAEQQAIAETLGAVDALLTAQRELLTKKRDLKQATQQALLSGERRLPGFAGEWEETSLKEDCTLKARIGWQGLTTSEYLKEGPYYLVTGTDFIDSKVQWQTCHYVEGDRYAQDPNIQLRVGDVLVTKDGTIGKAAYIDYLPKPATLNSGVFVLRPKGRGYYPLFLFYILRSKVFDDFLEQLVAGSTIVHLYQKDFINFNFLAPSLPEQRAIAAILSDMDAELEALAAQLAKTQALKQGLMQELLTGRRRLHPGAVAPSPTPAP